MANDANDQFFELIRRVRDGDDDAFAELVKSYGRLVLYAVRRRMNPAIRSKFDSTDFVQAVWASFHNNRSQVDRFQSPQDLIHFLADVARNKVVDECRRRLKSKCWNVNREISLEASDVQPILAPLPTSSELAIAEERWTNLMEGKPSGIVHVAELKRLGMTHAEVAEKLGVNEKTVQRILRRIRDQEDARN